MNEQGYSVAEAAKSLVVGTSVLYKWKEKFEALRQGITLEKSERDEMNRLQKKQSIKYGKGNIKKRLL